MSRRLIAGPDLGIHVDLGRHVTTSRKEFPESLPDTLVVCLYSSARILTELANVAGLPHGPLARVSDFGARMLSL